MIHKVQSYLTEQEERDLLRQPNRTKLQGKRDYAVLLLDLRTGCRISELCNLKVSNLKTEGKKIWLYVYGKGKRERRIPIKDSEIIEALQSYWKKANYSDDPNEPMFKTLGRKGLNDIRPLTWKAARWLLKKYTKLAKIDKNIHFHSLRHTFLTRTLRTSGDLPAVQALAGHRSIQSTQVYLHTDEERMERAIESLRH